MHETEVEYTQAEFAAALDEEEGKIGRFTSPFTGAVQEVRYPADFATGGVLPERTHLIRETA